MSELIDRQATIEAIKTANINFNITSTIDFSKYKKEIQEIVDNIVLAQIKAIESLENKKTGHWIYICNSGVNGLKVVECSECGNRTFGSGNYCPNCGANMRGE